VTARVLSKSVRELHDRAGDSLWALSLEIPFVITPIGGPFAAQRRLQKLQMPKRFFHIFTLIGESALQAEAPLDQPTTFLTSAEARSKAWTQIWSVLAADRSR
jgi:hypothetical protein